MTELTESNAAVMHLCGQMDVYVPLLQQIEANIISIRDNFAGCEDRMKALNSGPWRDLNDATVQISNAYNRLNDMIMKCVHDPEYRQKIHTPANRKAD